MGWSFNNINCDFCSCSSASANETPTFKKSYILVNNFPFTIPRERRRSAVFRLVFDESEGVSSSRGVSPAMKRSLHLDSIVEAQ